MKRIFTLLFFCLSILPAFAQREADNWYFGDFASLEFSKNGIPTSGSNSAMSTMEGCASISDEFGNLLFYTNGETIWNALHLPMANGTGLNGNWSASQSAVILQKPGSNSVYYVFTADASGPTNRGIHYNEIDMTAFNGLGEVKSSAKNVPLFTAGQQPQFSEKLTAVYASNHRDFWVIAHRYPNTNDQQFLAYKVTSAGVSLQPVISTFPSNRASPFTTELGYMKTSPNGRFLGINYVMGDCQLYNFDAKTGALSGQLILGNGANHNYYGLEFSPDGGKFYTVNTTNNQLEQYNLGNSQPGAILGSRFIVASFNGAALQLASNGKIYAVKPNTDNLNVINNPNAAGAACNFQAGPTLAPLTFCRMGLPNFMTGLFAPPRFTVTGICAESPFLFTITDQAGIDSVKWDFGDPLSGVTNTSGSRQPTHIYHRSGFYKVTLTVFMGGEASFFTRQVDVKNAPLVGLGPDTIVCEGTQLSLANSFPTSAFNETLLWNTGDKGRNITVSTSGYYWLELSNGTCTTRDSVKVTFVPGPKVNLAGDTSVCGTAPLTLKPKQIDPKATYVWQPGGQTTPTIQVTKSGFYQVTVMKNGCQATAFRNVYFTPTIGVNLGPDQELCEGEEVLLKAPVFNPPPVYLWSDTSAGKNLLVKKSGKYWVRVTRNGCTVSDTVNIKFKPCPPPIIPFIPNIISPNADGKNDKFVIGNLPEGVFWSLKIYNRWGLQVFEDPLYQHNWPEKKLTDGIYYYLLEEPGTGRTWKGWLEVVH